MNKIVRTIILLLFSMISAILANIFEIGEFWYEYRVILVITALVLMLLAIGFTYIENDD